MPIVRELTIEEKIKQVFPEEPDLMLRIVEAESNLNAKAYNPEWHKGCQGSYGLFQIACVNYSGDPDDLFDPDINLEIARKVYDSQGIFAWGVCHNHMVDCN